MRNEDSLAENEVKKLKNRIAQLAEEHGHSFDYELHSDLSTITAEKTAKIQQVYPEGSFSRLFWEKKLKAAQAKDSCQFRLHSLIIRWCLNLKPLSTSAYRAMRSAGFIKLPSERTL